MKKVFSFLQPFVITLIIIVLLQVTGQWSNVSSATQKIALKTGALNADADFKKPSGEFDYQFNLIDLDGNAKSGADLKGKVVFLNLWATWCGPCKAEMPGIHSLYQKMKDQPIEFVMLSVDRPSTQNKVVSYLKNNEYTFPVYMLSGQVPEILQVPSIPTTYIIDKNGKIVSTEVGAKNYDTNKMVKALTELASK